MVYSVNRFIKGLLCYRYGSSVRKGYYVMCKVDKLSCQVSQCSGVKKVSLYQRYKNLHPSSFDGHPTEKPPGDKTSGVVYSTKSLTEEQTGDPP